MDSRCLQDLIDMIWWMFMLVCRLLKVKWCSWIGLVFVVVKMVLECPPKFEYSKAEFEEYNLIAVVERFMVKVDWVGGAVLIT